MHQHRSVEKLGLFDQHIGKNIRAIGKTEADDRTGLIMLPVRLDEIGELFGCALKVGHVVDALARTPEKPRRAVFGNIADR
ncbi:hypothetical protein D3C71_1231040 [compost metagenome]